MTPVVAYWEEHPDFISKEPRPIQSRLPVANELRTPLHTHHPFFFKKQQINNSKASHLPFPALTKPLSLAMK